MTNTLGQEIQIGLITLGYYRREMERLLRHGQENLLAKIQHDFGPKISLVSVNPIVAQDFPRYLRYSFIILLYSFVGNQLEAVCINVGLHKNFSEEEVKNFL